MWWLSRKPVTVHVEFYEDGGGILGQGDFPPERLPESFEAETTLEMMEQKWLVMRADPLTKAEFMRTGKLRLVLKKMPPVQKISPHDILFSLPTISGEWPPLESGTSKANKNVLELHEDDWRQIEFVPIAERGLTDECLKGIAEIWEKQRQGPGFKTCYPREVTYSPLRIPLAELRLAAGARATWLEGIGIQRSAGLVPGGFALQMLSSVALYGQVQGDVVVRLCVHNRWRNNVGAEDLEGLEALAERHGLEVVDWCRMERAAAGDGGWAEFFCPPPATT